MLTFNPGPSQISAETEKDIALAMQKHIAKISHRSADFSQISAQAINGLREYFQIPDNYKIFYTSSATEAMQLSLQNCCAQKSFHFVNGSFSDLYAKIAQSLHKDVVTDRAEWGMQNNFQAVQIPEDCDFISITHNETSTGVMCQSEQIKFVREKYPQAILAVDITSAAGAVKMQIADADIWFFSVQKCLGLPAGLGVIFVSPQAYQRSLELLEQKKNSGGVFNFPNMWQKMETKYQTVCTPNVLKIFLLAQQMERWKRMGGINKMVTETKRKLDLFNQFLTTQKSITHFVPTADDRSETVFCLRAEEDLIAKLHQNATKEELVLGKGYGKLKPHTFRIANFPAITFAEMQRLTDFLRKNILQWLPKDELEIKS